MARSKSNYRRSNRNNRKRNHADKRDQTTALPDLKALNDLGVAVFDEKKIDSPLDSPNDAENLNKTLEPINMVELEAEKQATEQPLDFNFELPSEDDPQSLDDLHSLLLESLLADENQTEQTQDAKDCLEQNEVCEETTNEIANLSFPASAIDSDGDEFTKQEYDINEVFALAKEIGREFDAAPENQVESETEAFEQPLATEWFMTESAGISERLSRLENRLTESLSRVEQRLEQMFDRMETTIGRVSASHQPEKQSSKILPNGEPTKKTLQKKVAPSDAKPTSGLSWELQKRKMLAEFGMLDGDFDDQDLDEAICLPADACEEVQTEDELIIEKKTGMDAIYDSIAKLEGVAIDSEIIEQLKNELTGKLREAEVELSINRAKLSQEWANLDQMKSELQQRETALTSKYQQANGNEKPGLLDRFTRHLSKKKS